ncbi:L-arabinose-responsive transcription regulator ARA1 [Cladobotryum mycophilum]|uniref:L-arabinose-responsive transcription regulator ARA1 n=1 Tax=Cladobotryum mycophilum TaxID=491253 RepID=A0ABR0SIU8_9HYPO
MPTWLLNYTESLQSVAQKKKCDEKRPQCGRCEEHSQECNYEPVRPRQRRRHDYADSMSPMSMPSNPQMMDSRFSFLVRGSNFGNWEPSLWSNNFQVNETLAINRGRRVSAPVSLSNTLSNFMHGLPHVQGPRNGIDNPLFQPLGSDPTYLEHSPGDDDIEEIVRGDLTISATSSRRPSLAVTSPFPTPSPYLEFHAPAFAEFSDKANRRLLLDHFANVLSHLIVLHEDQGNPFQQLVLPLAHKSPTVMNAVCALSSAHLEYGGVQNAEKSFQFHIQAIGGLSRLIQEGCRWNRNELLAAIMLLVYCEVLVQPGRPNIVQNHLKGAMAIMDNNPTLTDPTGVFLERAFRFYDVITALSFGTAPISRALESGGSAPFPPIDCHGATVPAGNADALLGMATSLWPIIHRLSTLGGLKEQINLAESQGDDATVAHLRAELETTASAIELDLERWQPIRQPEATLQDYERLSRDELTAKRRMQSITNSALAYRDSGFVYLYRTVYGRPRSDKEVQRYTHYSLTHCVGTTENKGPMGSLLWPLFVAACEAVDPEDRDLAKEAFAGVGQRQGMANIDRSWHIVQEVWRRADNGEDTQSNSLLLDYRKEDLWRIVSHEMEVSVVFG